MADYFSKYRGRGGPAIEPGILQMMGSIGDEYGKGITSFADSIASGIEAKAEREKTEEANNLLKDLLSGPKKVESPEAYAEYISNKAETDLMLAEEVKLSEEAEEKAVLESKEMHKRISVKPLFTGASANDPNRFSGEAPNEFPDDITYNQDRSSSQVGALNKEIAKFQKPYDEKTKKLSELDTKKTELLAEIHSLEDKAIAGIGISRASDSDKRRSSYSPPSLSPKEKETLKEKNVILQRINKRIDTLGGKDYSTIGDHLEKLRSLKQMEVHQPGASVGFSKIVRGPSGDWLEETDERGRIVEERRKIFNYMTSSPEWGTRSSQFPLSSGAGLAQMVDETTIKGLGVRVEDLNAILTLPQEEMDSTVVAAKNRMRIAHDKLQEYRSREPLTQQNFMRDQTRQELVADVIQKVDTGKLRKDVLPFVASYLNKTQEPSVVSKTIDGQTYLLADPKVTSVTKVGSDLTSKLAVSKFQREIAQGNYRNTVELDKDFNSRRSALTAEIAKYAKGKETQLSPFDDDGLTEWGAADEKRLTELRTSLQDLQRIYGSQRKKLAGNQSLLPSNEPTISF